MKKVILTILLAVSSVFGADYGNILESRSVPSDMRYSTSGNKIIWNTKSNWCTKNTTIARTFRFNIPNSVNITSFKISKIVFPDWVRVTVNGTRVLSYPYGDYWDKKSKYASNYRCDVINNTSTYNQTKYPNKNILPYLKKGSNSIVVHTIVSGNCGGVRLEFTHSSTKTVSPICGSDEYLNSGNKDECIKNSYDPNALCEENIIQPGTSSKFTIENDSKSGF